MKVAIVLSLACFLGLATGHGRLRDPPSRSSAWRDGFDTPPNWTDNELYCGGFGTQQQNGGKCGICGDPWNKPEPRDNELGGIYGKGVITRTYKKGQVIDIWIQLTSNHMGKFVFRICPLTNPGPGNDATQECLDKHVLQLADGSGTVFKVPGSVFSFKLKLKLPSDLSCDHCVVQWDYTAGNRWDYCPDGTGAVGCGPQETFRGCSDVKILP